MNDQVKLWNGAAGSGWVETQAITDRLFRPFDTMLVEGITGPVLDVGCGTGSTTVAAARAAGACVGVDISEPMLEAARARAQREGVHATFLRADAGSHVFEPASFDAIISRFGVMFFDDPVRAFTNLHHAAVDGAPLRFIAWRSIDENPFMTTAERAAALPPRDPTAPGQFAFSDPARVRAILDGSGWGDVELRAIDVDCAMREEELGVYVTRLGPLARVLPDVEEPRRTRVIETVLEAFRPYVHDGEVRFNAACWLVRAARGGNTRAPR